MPRLRALDRTRLSAVATKLNEYRLVLVVAPAGSGKTTLLAQFAADSPGPVAWYRADSADTAPAAVLAHLERTLTDALDGIAPAWASVDDACAALDAYDGAPAVLAVDDLHVLHDSAGEGVLARLVDNLPPQITVVCASRRAPGFDISRLRVSGEVLELGAGDLRFRSWEVEALFRDFYGEPLLPEELAELARRTDGWAAGLQLFHLATRGKSNQERRRLLEALGGRARLVREYLTANVIDDLPRDLRRFLLDTCVLGRLTAEWCDAVRGAGDSAAWLAELDERQIFTQALEEDGSFRYHEVLQSHLEALLVEEFGERTRHERYRAAGELLERSGALPDALRAYCRAEDWDAATRLLGGSGERAIADRGRWLDLLPTSMIDQDPWLMLASARRFLASGDWSAAARRYQHAESAFRAGPGSETARRERQTLAAWLQAVPVPTTDWAGAVRSATIREPQAARHRAAGLDGATGLLAAGLSALLAGSTRDARRCLDAAAQRSDTSDVVALGAELASSVAALLSGASVGDTSLEAACDRADRLGVNALAWLGRTAARIDSSLLPSGAGPIPLSDEWATAVDALCTSLGEVRGGGAPLARSEEAVRTLRRLGAGTLEAWARAIHAVAAARAGAPEARETALAAESFARSTGVPGAMGVAYAALADADPARQDEYHALRKSVEDECGLDVRSLVPPARTSPGYDALGSEAATRGPLVGRSREVAELRRLVDATCAGAGGVVDVFAGVRDLVARRVAGLSSGTDGVLHAATVIGRTFTLTLLERVAEVSADRVLVAVAEAERAGLVEPAWADAGQYTFTHALVHEALYEQLDAVARVRLHRRAGDAIEAAAGSFADGRVAELAHHFLRAAGDGGVDKAVAYAVRAGQSATVTGAYDEAERQCEAALALLDGAELSADRQTELLETLADLRARGGLPRTLSLRVRCLGRFEIAVGGDALDLGAVKPRHRSLLRLLAARADRPVHREELIEALWPGECDPKAATRNLQVAISTVRRLLEPDARRGQASLLVREGDAYRLRVPADADVDVADLGRAVDAGRLAAARGDVDAAAAQFTRALDLYAGDLLPEEGPAEWVVKARERLRLDAAEAAQGLATIELERGRAAAAASVGERGLQIDRFRDGLWRLVIDAHEQSGDAAAAARARRGYDEVLTELGVRT